MLRKIALGLIALAVLWFGGRALIWAFASDETQIRWKLEAACEAFTDTRMSPILDILAREYVDESTGRTREELRAGIAGTFFTAKDPTTRKFPYRAEFVPETLSIEVDRAKQDTARLRTTMRITDVSQGGERVAWEFTMNAELRDGDDGWQIVSTTHEDVRGDKRL